MIKDTALVIVDVQPEFIPANHPSYNNIKILFKSAVEKKIPIITLEYRDCGRTPKSLRGPRHRCRTKIKDQDDGSTEVLEACEDLRIQPKKLVFCGYNYDACVLETIENLDPKEDGEVIVVKDATNFYWESARRRFNNRTGTFLRAYRQMRHVSHHDMYKNSRFPSGCWCDEKSCRR